MKRNAIHKPPKTGDDKKENPPNRGIEIFLYKNLIITSPSI